MCKQIIVYEYYGASTNNIMEDLWSAGIVRSSNERVMWVEALGWAAAMLAASDREDPLSTSKPFRMIVLL